MKRHLGLVLATAVVIVCGGLPNIALAGEQRAPLMATVKAVAPIYIGPKVQPTPLRTAAVGTRLEVLTEEGDWVQVRFGDPVLGPRVGWVQANLIQIERPELQPMDLSVEPSRPAGAPRSRTATPGSDNSARSVGQVEPSGIQRTGFLIGLSAGPGFLSCEDCDWRTGFAFDFHVGGMVGPNVGLMYDGVATAIDVDGAIVTLATTTVAVQGFTGERGWVKGGVGFGVINCDGCLAIDVSEVGWGLMGGAGVEVLQRGKFAMDVQGRFTFNQFEGIRFYSATATLGFNWY